MVRDLSQGKENKMRLLVTLVSATLVSITSVSFANAQESAISITAATNCLAVHNKTTGAMKFAEGCVTVTARAEKVVVKNMVVNRGNCETYFPVTAVYSLSFELAFGEKKEILWKCDPIEVTIETDAGSETFEFR